MGAADNCEGQEGVLWGYKKGIGRTGRELKSPLGFFRISARWANLIVCKLHSGGADVESDHPQLIQLKRIK